MHLPANACNTFSIPYIRSGRVRVFVTQDRSCLTAKHRNTAQRVAANAPGIEVSPPAGCEPRQRRCVSQSVVIVVFMITKHYHGAVLAQGAWLHRTMHGTTFGPGVITPLARLPCPAAGPHETPPRSACMVGPCLPTAPGWGRAGCRQPCSWRVLHTLRVHLQAARRLIRLAQQLAGSLARSYAERAGASLLGLHAHRWPAVDQPRPGTAAGM